MAPTSVKPALRYSPLAGSEFAIVWQNTCAQREEEEEEEEVG
jgi:hypothetical protein